MLRLRLGTMSTILKHMASTHIYPASFYISFVRCSSLHDSAKLPANQVHQDPPPPHH